MISLDTGGKSRNVYTFVGLDDGDVRYTAVESPEHIERCPIDVWDDWVTRKGIIRVEKESDMQHAFSHTLHPGDVVSNADSWRRPTGIDGKTRTIVAVDETRVVFYETDPETTTQVDVRAWDLWVGSSGVTFLSRGNRRLKPPSIDVYAAIKPEPVESKADLLAAAKERYLKEFDSALAQSYDMGVRDGLDMIAEAIKSMTSPDTDAAFKECVSEALKKLKAE